MSVSEPEASAIRRARQQLFKAAAQAEAVFGRQVAHDLLVNLVEMYEIILSAEANNGDER